MAIEQTRARVEFGPFALNRQSGELWKHGVRVRLQEQPFQVLLALLERPGEVVTREELRTRIWGSDTFVDFDHGLSAAVNRLRAALGDAADQPKYVETVARRGYRFIGTLKEQEAAAEVAMAAAPAEEAKRRGWMWPAAAVVAAAVIGAVWWMGPRPAPQPRLVQVTTDVGSETHPSLSPDGEQIAYVWNGEKEDNSEIYVKQVGSPTGLRLTNDAGADLLPSWSPDGKQIAFVRVKGTTGIYVVSPLGGAEQKVTEFPGLDGRTPGPESKIVGDLLYPTAGRPSWTPDGKYLAVTHYGEPPAEGDGRVLLVPAEGGEPRAILTPGAGERYQTPTVSPDGKKMAVVRCGDWKPPCRIEVVALNERYEPEGEPQVLLPFTGQVRGIAWEADGKGLVVGGFNLPRFYSWRVRLDKPGERERIELAGPDAIWPTVSRRGGRMAFGRSILQADLWKLEKGGKPEFFLSSTSRETMPALAPDGRRVAFQSARDGENQIWMGTVDGQVLRQLTRRREGTSGAPSWSPDGKRVAFDTAGKDGRFDIAVVDTEGGPERLLTEGPGTHARPEWSPDGKTIYFRSDRSGQAEIWRIPANGGRMEQVTRKGGHSPAVSRDGKRLFFLAHGDGHDGIWEEPVGGGERRQLIPDTIVRASYTVAEGGIYYITPRDENWCDIRFHDFATGRRENVAEIQRPVAFGLAVSRDGKLFLSSRPITGSDLMMIDEYR